MLHSPRVGDGGEGGRAAALLFSLIHSLFWPCFPRALLSKSIYVTFGISHPASQPPPSSQPSEIISIITSITSSSLLCRRIKHYIGYTMQSILQIMGFKLIHHRIMGCKEHTTNRTAVVAAAETWRVSQWMLLLLLVVVVATSKVLAVPHGPPTHQSRRGKGEGGKADSVQLGKESKERARDSSSL